MKNIILQHWTGEMDELGTLSSANISAYAEYCGADYKLLRGNVFRPNLSAPCQKMFMLDQSFDEYNNVVMLDIDMFAHKTLRINIFDETITGVGMVTQMQLDLFDSLRKRSPDLANINYPYWGGAIYKLPQQLRLTLRQNLHRLDLFRYNAANCEDEGIMHRLATLAKIEKCCLPDENRWCCGSYEPNVHEAHIIHIRKKTSLTGPKRSKIENYRDLVKRGLIDG